MTWWQILLGLGGIAGLFFGLAVFFDSDFWFGSFLCAGAVFVIAALCIGIGQAVLHTDRAGCKAYQRETGRPTKFARYTWATWECLTRADDGRWIPTSELGDYDR